MSIGVRYFSGTSLDFAAIEDAVHHWQDQEKPGAVNVNTAFHYDEKEQRWDVLVCIVFQDKAPSPSVGIPLPSGLFRPPGVN